MVGAYYVHERLGQGGMGAVHRAVDTRTGQEVALKLLLAVTDERARRRLILEARALVRLRHRNVVALLDAGEDRGHPWIALELVRGRSLQERLDREGPLAPREAARLVLGLAAGLTHAHREGVLHRDLKPANVLLPADGGDPKLADFGLAGFTFDLGQSRLTTSGILMGSPGYWSPEQASGRASAVSPQTDVYGLGALLYAALTGRPPIDGPSLPEVLIATATRRPEAPGADQVLDAITLRCMEKDLADRYPSVSVVERELLRYLAGAPRRGRGRGRAVLAGLVITLIATAVALTTLPTPVDSPPAPSLGQAPSPVDSPGRTESSPLEDPTPLAAPFDAKGEAEALLASATTKARLGDVRGAVQDYDRAIELDPRSADAHHYRGVAKASLGDFRGAIPDFDRTIELDPHSPDAYQNRGLAKLRLGDFRGAILDLDRTIELDPRSPDAYQNRGVARANLGDSQGAIQDYDRVIELDPRSARAYSDRGLAKARLGDVRGAVQDYDRAIELDPRSARSYSDRGLAKLVLRDFRGAISDCDRALELDPRGAVAHSSRGAAKIGLGDLQGAIQDLDRAIELDPRDAVAHLSRGEAKASLGDHRGAVADFEEALRLEPNAAWTGAVRDRIARRE